jgi:hypothetical protein
MKKRLLFILFLGIAAVYPQETVLKLVYKDSGKQPYMQTAPDSSGLYLDLIGLACEKAGYRLEVIRVPKARTYLLLETGAADLYPALIFNRDRSEFIAFIKNGLFRQENYYGISAQNIPEIRSYKDLRGSGLIWIIELGGSLKAEAEKNQIDFSSIKDLDISKAVQLISKGRPFFYRAVDEELEDYLAAKKLESLNELGIKMHTGIFLPLDAPLYTGFSRKSPLYREELNPYYNKKIPPGADNLPYRLVKDSVPYRLQEAFDGLIRSGEVGRLLKKYKLENF